MRPRPQGRQGRAGPARGRPGIRGFCAGLARLDWRHPNLHRNHAFVGANRFATLFLRVFKTCLGCC
jgi:hypothetical protein